MTDAADTETEADHSDADPDHGEHDHGHTNPAYPDPPERSTAPQSEYELNQVATGFAVLLVGILITIALPLLL